IETIAVGRQERNRLFALCRGPRPSIESLDDPEFDLHIPTLVRFRNNGTDYMRRRKSGAAGAPDGAVRLAGAGRGVLGGLAAVLVGLTTACAQEARPDSDPAGGKSGAESGQFVASVSGEVYYWVGCDHRRSMQAAHRRWIATSGDPEDAGYPGSTARGCESPDLLAGPTPLDTGRCTVTRVADGDTLACAEAAERSRLLLIDAPEQAQGVAGEEARAALERLLPVGTIARVELDVQERDRYGRILAYLYTPDDTLVNEDLARAGFGTALVIPPNVKHEASIRAAVSEIGR